MLPNQQVSALFEEYGMLETELCFLSYLKYYFSQHPQVARPCNTRFYQWICLLSALQYLMVRELRPLLHLDT